MVKEMMKKASKKISRLDAFVHVEALRPFLFRDENDYNFTSSSISETNGSYFYLRMVIYELVKSDQFLK